MARIKRQLVWALFFCLAAALPGCGQKGMEVKEPETTAVESKRQLQDEKETVEESLPAQGSGEETADAAEEFSVCGSYFKEGNFDDLLVISEMSTPEQKELVYEVRQRIPGEEIIQNQVILRGKLGEAEDNISIDQQGEGIFNLVVSDGVNSDLSGSYYRMEEYLPMYEMFVRPLNQADLMGKTKEELRILRNECYAVYGRKFSDPELRAYFLDQPWYRELVEPDQFNSAFFSDVIKENIKFLQDAENGFNRETEIRNQKYSELPDTPYKELIRRQIQVCSRQELPWFEGIGVKLNMDTAELEDMGLYYRIRGEIKAPLTITREEYEKIMSGEEVQVIFNEVSGEMADIRRNRENQGPLLYFSGQEMREEIYNCQYLSQYDRYILTIVNDELLFKTIYQGDIYVLKGAESSFAQAIYQLVEGSETRKIEPGAADEIRGSSVSFDEKGYIRAVIDTGA